MEPQHDGNEGMLVNALFVDASPFILKTLSSILEGEDHVQLVGAATDGNGAVRPVVEREPGLVLIDPHLPGMSGRETTLRTKAHSPATVVIMVTADDTSEIRVADSGAGVDRFVGKQHIFTQLPAAIRKLFPENGSSYN
jgi:DNA-binding NarL/FixJ family response regulator